MVVFENKELPNSHFLIRKSFSYCSVHLSRPNRCLKIECINGNVLNRQILQYVLLYFKCLKKTYQHNQNTNLQTLKIRSHYFGIYFPTLNI